MNEPEEKRRSLDAIPLATARLLGADLAGLVSYDDRLAIAARDARITVICSRLNRERQVRRELQRGWRALSPAMGEPRAACFVKQFA